MMRAPSDNYISTLLHKLSGLSIPLLFMTILLCAGGVAMQYSAGGGSLQPWAYPHILRFGVGTAIMLTLALASQKALFRYAYHLYIAGIVLLIAVEIFGHIGMGAQRWVRIGSLTIQPSEPMKLFTVLALARFYHMLGAEESSKSIFPIMPIIIIGIPALLILLQPNLGTATILGLTGLSVMMAAGTRIGFFGIVLAGLSIMAPLGWSSLHDYQKRRITTFLNPENDPLGAGYNILQSKIAIGAGGVSGKGYLLGSQSQLSFLPEKHTDFIFTMVAEEFGFMGCILLLALFMFLIYYIIWITGAAANQFGRMIGIGIATMIFLHVFINMGMVMGLLPVVGVPLPFLSYGGTMQFTIMAAMGLVLNIYINRDTKLIRSSGDFYRYG